MQTLRVCLVIIASSPAWAGWQKDCRHQLHHAFQSARADLKQCRLDHGTTTTTTSTTSTTLPPITLRPYHDLVSQNCQPQPQGCVAVSGPLEWNGHILCPPLNVMTVCSFPSPPCPLVQPIAGTACVTVLVPGVPPGRYCPASSPSGAFF